jgi:hypothetical protein
MLSSSVQNSEGRGDGNSGDGFADPCQEFKEGFFGVYNKYKFLFFKDGRISSPAAEFFVRYLAEMYGQSW